jgi:RNA polymerase sigma factor (sigma-70 family)
MEHQEFIGLKLQLKTGNNDELKFIFEANALYCIHKLVSEHRCSKDDAEDIYSDSVLNFREKIVSDKIDSIINLRSYLYATCRNMLLAKLKKKELVDSAAIEHYADSLESELDETEIYREKIIKLTIEALSSLPEKCREILKAFYFDRLSMEEIAQKMKLANPNVAKVSKARCFQNLLEQIKVLQYGDKRNDAIK